MEILGGRTKAFMEPVYESTPPLGISWKSSDEEGWSKCDLLRCGSRRERNRLQEIKRSAALFISSYAVTVRKGDRSMSSFHDDRLLEAEADCSETFP
jgi:hypothetical protein